MEIVSAAEFEEGWDRWFYNQSARFGEVPCRIFEHLRFRLVAPLGKFDCYENTVSEIAFRAIGAVAAFFALFTIAIPAAFVWVGFRSIGYFLQKNGFTYIKGTSSEVERNEKVTCLTANIGGIAGGMTYDHCGIPHWRERVEAIAQKILESDADVITLQEIYDATLMEELVTRLKDHYPHFFTHLGKNILGSEGGILMMTRCPVHSFANTLFDNNSRELQRSFGTLFIKKSEKDDAPSALVVGTHCIHTNPEDAKQQIRQIVAVTQSVECPLVLMGDLNLQRDDPQEGGYLSTLFTHSYQGDQPTATNELLAQWNSEWNPKKQGTPGEFIDYISLLKKTAGTAYFANTRLFEMFNNTYNTKTALSDHNGIITDLYYN